MFLQASVCPRGRGVGLSASVHAGIPHPPGADTPWQQTPPGSRHPPEQTPLEQTPPGADTPHGADTPRSRHPPTADTHPPGSKQPPPGADTTPEQTPPEQTPPHPRDTVTAADGTHHTGMHSCVMTICFSDGLGGGCIIAGFPLGLENLEKWETGQSQGILNRLEKSGKIEQNTGKLR